MTPHDFEHSLNVPDVVDQIREDDEVEPLGKREIVRIRHDEADLGMTCRRKLDHLWREIHTDANGRRQCGQQIARPASDFEDALSRRNDGSIDFPQPLVVALVRPIETAERSCHLIPVLNPFGTVGAFRVRAGA